MSCPQKTLDTSPNIGIQAFRKEQTAGRNEILFNELIGENLIESYHSHDFFIIILFEIGSGVHSIDSQKYPINNKEIHVLFPGQMHKWQMEANTKGYQLMVEKPFLEQFAPFFRFSFTNYQNNPIIPLSDAAFKKLHYEFKAIKDDLSTANMPLTLISARSAVIAALVSVQAEKHFSEFKIYQFHEKLTQYNLLIDEFFKENKSVQFYAEKLNISSNYLNILCKRNLKVSATKLIQQRTLTESKRLLQQNKLSIKEIAFDLGFSDVAHFSSFFKKQTNLTPSEFKNNSLA